MPQPPTTLTKAKPAFASLITLRDIQALAAVSSGKADHPFLHIPKNAGVSMRRTRELRWKMVGVHRQFLRDRRYLRDLLKTMGDANKHHGIAHARLRDVKPWLAARLTPVAVIRNPRARTVSRYRFAQMAAQQGNSLDSARVMSFEAFLDTRFADGNKPFFWHRAVRGWYPQRDYVVDDDGNIAADLLRQEHWGDEARAYFDLAKPLERRNTTRTDASQD
ncbi:hypothetical protein KUL25_19095 [Rhodobacteraceae bacterium N5(2021)]|uniref:Sulfotransferase family protein n=1 Tax=Gymnodinialimonas phycosphaerae TaxID=2841589 RepID=A0A975TU02_9RHOB|nr:hypothetical protein [Gymnodinialimonas phycosphaerae]MBY4894870.1 hypothetical protein [Gymnodinialimonas phycosphaerae]